MMSVMPKLAVALAMLAYVGSRAASADRRTNVPIHDDSLRVERWVEAYFIMALDALFSRADAIT